MEITVFNIADDRLVSLAESLLRLFLSEATPAISLRGQIRRRAVAASRQYAAFIELLAA